METRQDSLELQAGGGKLARIEVVGLIQVIFGRIFTIARAASYDGD